MSEEAMETDLSRWFSTYGLLTSARILERFNIKLENDELTTAMKDPFNVYHRLLVVPLKNVFNGIIMQQAHDYLVYAQKLFVDYLLSGETGKGADSPGANTREELEDERVKLTEVAEAFNDLELDHQNLIAESQGSLLKVAQSLQKALTAVVKKVGSELQTQHISKEPSLIERAIRLSMVYYSHTNNESITSNSAFWVTMADVLDIQLDDNLQQKLEAAVSGLNEIVKNIENILPEYLEKTNDIGVSFRSYRSQFYDIILRVTEYLNLLPDYRINLAQVEENRSTLYFDSHIGDA
jgi:hypothetical protein